MSYIGVLDQDVRDARACGAPFAQPAVSIRVLIYLQYRHTWAHCFGSPGRTPRPEGGHRDRRLLSLCCLLSSVEARRAPSLAWLLCPFPPPLHRIGFVTPLGGARGWNRGRSSRDPRRGPDRQELGAVVAPHRRDSPSSAPPLPPAGTGNDRTWIDCSSFSGKGADPAWWISQRVNFAPILSSFAASNKSQSVCSCRDLFLWLWSVNNKGEGKLIQSRCQWVEL